MGQQIKNDLRAVNQQLNKVYQFSYESLMSVATREDSMISSCRSVITTPYYLDKELTSDDCRNFKSNNHKSFLISTLVNATNYNIVEKVLNDLGVSIPQVFDNYDGIMDSDEWHSILLKTPMKPFTLLNLFVTNNNEPQCVYLGQQLTIYNDKRRQQDHFVCFDDNKDVLLKPKFLWNVDDPISVYKNDLVNLDSNITTDELLEKLNQLYISKIQNDSYEFVNTNDRNVIVYLDLEWFISQFYSFRILHDAKTVASKPEMQSVMKWLAAQL